VSFISTVTVQYIKEGMDQANRSPPAEWMYFKALPIECRRSFGELGLHLRSIGTEHTSQLSNCHAFHQRSKGHFRTSLQPVRHTASTIWRIDRTILGLLTVSDLRRAKGSK
jgi:hypothetical protein